MKQNDPYHQFTLDELIGVLAANNLYYPLEKRPIVYKYSDTGYSILAKIVERVSGTSYERFIRDNFFTPRGLSETSAPWNSYDNAIPSPFMKGYYRWDAAFAEIFEDNMSDQVGPGNIISTPADMARWARGTFSGRGALSREQVERMWKVPADYQKKYGLGMEHYAAGFGHNGGHPGYVNLVAYNPKDDVSVVVVTPFIDYNAGSLDKVREQLKLLEEVAMEARRLAGYTAVWAP